MLQNRTNQPYLDRQTTRYYYKNETGRGKSSRERSQFMPANSERLPSKLYCYDIGSKKVGKIVKNQQLGADSTKENEFDKVRLNQKDKSIKQRVIGAIKTGMLNRTSTSVLPVKQRAHYQRIEMGLTITVESQYCQQEPMQTPKFAGNSETKQIPRQYQLVKQTKQQLLPNTSQKKRQY